ncbi:MAG TPA: LysM peptidoglycan-binding domain-containing protein [Actinomycetota bacterium]|nr:LysM peptidoglycan-binding domain-containing protein [Actinomycetota bacterium]
MAHPAVHGDRSRHSGEERLFPRAQGGNERAASMARHPSGRDCVVADHISVEPGDSLWSIAEAHLRTHDMRRIARYLPAVTRANRDVVPDPDLIFPGQNIDLPGECSR